MKKKTRKNSNGDAVLVTKEDHINFQISMMRHRDLQIACVVRGMDFQQVVNSSNHGLANWFFKNYDNSENPLLLTEYDAFIKSELEKRGYTKEDAIMAPCFRLGYHPEVEHIPEPKIIKPSQNNEAPKIEPMNKEKRTRDTETGVFSGTKKNLTYKLTKEGMAINDIIAKVTEQFPEAQEKSIKIWHKRCLKGE